MYAYICRLNEDAVETLFGCNSISSVPREATRKFVLPSFKQEIRILDSKKSQNIAILLRAFNVTREEVSEALLDGTYAFPDSPDKMQIQDIRYFKNDVCYSSQTLLTTEDTIYLFNE